MSPDLCHVIFRPLFLTHICSGFQLTNTGNSSYLEKEKTNKFSSVEKSVLRTYESGKVLHVWREQEKNTGRRRQVGPYWLLMPTTDFPNICSLLSTLLKNIFS